MALTNDELHVLAAFGRMPEGRALVTLLVKLQAESDVSLRTAAGDHLLRQQGRAQQLDELIEWLSGAAQKALDRQAPTRRQPAEYRV